ncbi:unnamed protein product [Durusdinium trenchii]|uniref:Glutaredoxin domain-containing protein n=1 Tax=Durusdinium trenchii TaxID=1381693 RepID=A0ABP0LUC1_9DINO
MIITPPWLDAKRRVTPRERAPAKLQEGVQLPVGVEQELRESIERKKMTARWAAKDLRLCHADTKGAKTAARVNAEAVALRPSSAVLTQPESLATPQRSAMPPRGSLPLAQLSHRLELCLGHKVISESAAEPIALPISARSRNMQKSVATHAKAIGIKEVGDLIGSVRCAEMPDGSKEELKSTWEVWLKDHLGNGGEIPVGNLPENAPGADPRWRSKGAQAKPSLNLGGVAGIASQAEAMDAVRQAVEENPIVLFMKGTPAMPQCGFSARTSGLLREIGVPFETVNVLDEANNPGVREAVKEFGQWPTIPQLYVAGQLVGGADIVMEMYQQGELEQMLVMANEGAGATGDAKGKSSSSAEYATGNVKLIDDPNRPTATDLCRALDKSFALVDLKVVDESAAHEGDAGALEMGLTSESHFSVTIVSPDFASLTRVQRQQKVYEALGGVMPRIHALSLVTRTPEETDDDGQ